MGLHRAGFEVVGVDIELQKNYPFEFHQQDALTADLSGFDAVWASPPCQKFSAATTGSAKNHLDLVAATREHLYGKPFIIENVPAAPLKDPVRLCGIMFGLKVIRHRHFESNVVLKTPIHKSHPGRLIGNGYFSIAGSRGKWRVWGTREISKGTHQEWCDAMGINWMTDKELTQAVPPAYSEYLGRQLIKIIS